MNWWEEPHINKTHWLFENIKHLKIGRASCRERV